MLPHKIIEQRLGEAVTKVLADADISNVLVRPCPDPKFGDYQSSALISLAKARKLNPRQLATDVVRHVVVGLVDRIPDEVFHTLQTLSHKRHKIYKDIRYPFTQTTCLISATTSTRSSWFFITFSIDL